MDLQTLGVEIEPAETGSDVADEIDTSGTDDTTTTETASDHNSDSDGDSGDTDGDGDADKKVDATKPGDGRTIPAKYKELFKNDKDLRSLYFQSQEFKKHFESPAKAAETLEQLSALGGFEGIASTQAEFAEIDRLFEAGDKAVLEKFLAKPGNKEGFAKLGPALFDEFRKLDEGGWTYEVARVMASTFAESGMVQDIDKLAILLKDNPEALAVVKKIGALVGGINKIATEAPKPKIDPEREKLNKERADFEKSKSDLFLQGVNNQIGVHIEKGIKTSLDPYLKNKKLDPESYSLIESNVGGELSRLMNADPQFTSQKDAVLKSGDKDRITKFFTAKISKHLPDACKKVMRAFGSIGSPATAAATVGGTKGTPTPTGVIKLSKAPNPEEIDYKKSGNMIIDGKAWLKNGKQVMWE